MGVGGTGYRTMGGLALSARAVPGATQVDVHSRSFSRGGFVVLRAAMALLAIPLIAGCNSLGGFTGAAAGIATGTFTTNPAIGIGVGVAVRAATDSAVKKVFRNLARDEQDVIASSAGQMNVGERRTWATHHRFGFGEAKGELMVVSDLSNALTSCKQVALSVADDKEDGQSSQWFLTQVCLQDQGRWKWAAAEPATGRWGSLQ